MISRATHPEDQLPRRMLPMLIATVLALGASGCKVDVNVPSLCFEGCTKTYPTGATLSIIGFPRAKFDSVGPASPNGGWYGRLAVGDSIQLWLVEHDSNALPCTAPDTLRSVEWVVSDSTVLPPRSDDNGRGVYRATHAGEAFVSARLRDGSLGGGTMWSCYPGGASRMSSIVVSP